MPSKEFKQRWGLSEASLASTLKADMLVAEAIARMSVPKVSEVSDPNEFLIKVFSSVGGTIFGPPAVIGTRGMVEPVLQVMHDVAAELWPDDLSKLEIIFMVSSSERDVWQVLKEVPLVDSISVLHTLKPTEP